MFIWTKQSIEWFERSAVKTDYYKKIAHKIVDYLPKQSNVCDLGCGLGYLSRELSNLSCKVTSIDKDPVLINMIEKRGDKNIRAICADAFSYDFRDRYNAYVMLSFGKADEILKLWNNSNVDKFFVIKHKPSHVSQKQKDSEYRTGTFVDKLSNKNILHITENITSEFGQFFLSLDEAIEYFRYYKLNKRMTQDIFINSLDIVDGEYPYYHQKNKDMIMVVLSRD